MQTRIAVKGPRDLNEAQRVYSPRDLQTVQNYQDKTNEAIMVLETNDHVLSSLRRFYEALLENTDFPWRNTSRAAVASFTRQIDEMIYDSNMQIARAKLLVQITTDRKSLVSKTVPVILPNIHLFTCQLTNNRAGSTASSESDDARDEDFDAQHAPYWCSVTEGGSHRANHHCGDLDISSSNVCICKLMLLSPGRTSSNHILDHIQH